MSSISIESTNQKSRSVTTYLRMAGIILLFAAAIKFLIQGIEELLPIYRYWTLPAFSIVLALCGLFCGFYMKESKGARIFFAISTAIVPLQVSQIGAMVHHYYHGEPLGYSGWWHFENIGFSFIAINTVTTLAIGLPLIYSGFSILARKHAKRLSIGLFIASAFILIPFRDTHTSTLLIASLFIFTRYFDKRYFRYDPIMKLVEGIIARVIMVIPFMIILGRSMFYPWSYLQSALILILLSVFLFTDIKDWVRSTVALKASELVGIASIVSGLLLFATNTIQNTEFLTNVDILFVSLPIAVSLYILSTKTEFYAKEFRALGAFIACFGTILYSLDNSTHFSAIVAIFVGFSLGLAGIYFKQTVTLVAGVVSFLSGVVFYMSYAMDIYNASPWLALTGIGINSLILASYIESEKTNAINLVKRYYQHVKNWD